VDFESSKPSGKVLRREQRQALAMIKYSGTQSYYVLIESRTVEVPRLRLT
jgi:hypothetical protein